MFIILLRFDEHKHKAPYFMSGHNDWIAKGLEDGVFLLVGSLQPKQGGAIIAKSETRTEIEARVENDPFVAEGIVSAEILEISPGKTDPRLAFLTGEKANNA